MIGFWVGFGIIFVLACAGSLVLNIDKSLKIRYIIFAAFIYAFIMSIVYGNLICEFIFGGLCLIVIFTNLSINFVQSDKKSLIKRIELVLDFIIGIGLTIYLIYIVPDNNLRDVMTNIIAAVYGGLLTLIGVVLTIHKGAKEKRLEEKKQAEPLFTYNQIFEVPNIKDKLNKTKTCFPINMEGDYFSDIYFEIENSNKSFFELMQVYHDGNAFGLENNTVVLQNGKVILAFRFNSPLGIFLILKDQLFNLYYYTVEVVYLNHQDKKNKHRLFTIRNLTPVSKEYYDEVTSKQNKEKKDE